MSDTQRERAQNATDIERMQFSIADLLAQRQALSMQLAYAALRAGQLRVKIDALEREQQASRAVIDELKRKCGA